MTPHAGLQVPIYPTVSSFHLRECCAFVLVGPMLGWTRISILRLPFFYAPSTSLCLVCMVLFFALAKLDQNYPPFLLLAPCSFHPTFTLSHTNSLSHTRAHTHTHSHTGTHTDTNTDTHTYIHMHKYTHTYTYIHRGSFVSSTFGQAGIHIPRQTDRQTDRQA